MDNKEDILKQFGGIAKHEFNNVLKLDEDPEDRERMAFVRSTFDRSAPLNNDHRFPNAIHRHSRFDYLDKLHFIRATFEVSSLFGQTTLY